jgi:hypothetical protein
LRFRVELFASACIDANDAISQIFFSGSGLGLDETFIDVLSECQLQVQRRHLFIVLRHSVIFFIYFGFTSEVIVLMLQDVILLLCEFEILLQAIDKVDLLVKLLFIPHFVLLLPVAIYNLQAVLLFL